MEIFKYGVSFIVIVGCLIMAAINSKDYFTPGSTVPGVSPLLYFVTAVLVFLYVTLPSKEKLRIDRESRHPDSRYITIGRPNKG